MHRVIAHVMCLWCIQGGESSFWLHPAGCLKMRVQMRWDKVTYTGKISRYSPHAS